jgi:hypothetical protein
MYSLALIIFVVSEKKAFEHFPIGSNVNLCPVVVCPYVCTLDDPLQTLRFLFRYEIQNGGCGRT